MTRDVTNAFARTAVDPAELLDVDMNQLARSFALIALRRLETETAELAHPNPRQDPRNRRERHIERLGDLRAGETQPAQRSDRLHALLARAMRDQPRRRRPIQQPELAVDSIAAHPLASAADADFGGRGRLRQRPPLINYPLAQTPALVQAERSVTVQIHPVSSLG